MTEAPRSVDYFFATMSPWTYLGHARFVRIAREAGATVRVRPMDLGQVFPVSGGLPLPKRAPQRQAYRLVELRRFADWLQLPLNLQPAFFPVKGDASAQLIVAVDQHDGSDAARCRLGRLLGARPRHRRPRHTGRPAASMWPAGRAAGAIPNTRRGRCLPGPHPGRHRWRRVRCAQLRARRRDFLGPGPARFSATTTWSKVTWVLLLN